MLTKRHLMHLMCFVSCLGGFARSGAPAWAADAKATPTTHEARGQGVVFYAERSHSGDGAYQKLLDTLLGLGDGPFGLLDYALATRVLVPIRPEDHAGCTAFMYWPDEVDEPLLSWSSPDIWERRGATGIRDEFGTRKGTPDPAAFGVGLKAAAAIAKKSRARIAVAGFDVGEWVDASQLPTLKAVSAEIRVDIMSYGEDATGGAGK